MITKLKSLFEFSKLSYRNQSRWESFKKWLPIVTRKWHNKELQSRLNSQYKQLESEFKRGEKLTSELLARLRQSVTITPYQQGRPPFDVRLEMTIDPYLLHRAMYDLSGVTTEEQHHIAKHLSRHVAYLVERELMTVNLATVGHYREMYERMNKMLYPPYRQVGLDDNNRSFPTTKRGE